MAIVSSSGDAAAVALVFMNTILGGAGGAVGALVCNYFYAMFKGNMPRITDD